MKIVFSSVRLEQESYVSGKKVGLLRIVMESVNSYVKHGTIIGLKSEVKGERDIEREPERQTQAEREGRTGGKTRRLRETDRRKMSDKKIRRETHMETDT